ncbi:hypothetical protein B0H12DRAFT_1322295 [Mycena haematopus]|nr:hypothetical protein B0H12DRAFT_1322295 [Mycena haematopus]
MDSASIREALTPPSPRASGTSFRAVTIAVGGIEARKAIDEEMAWHYAQIALLKAKRNAMAPISTLPNELMTRIFTIFAVDSDALFNLKWTKIIYVCRHWHALAQAAYPLWSFIDLSTGANFDRFYEQIMRSGTAPLSLKMTLYDGGYSGVILSHSERICELVLKGVSKHVYEVITKLSDHKFPILSFLSLDPSYQQDELPVDFAQALPDVLFDGRLPSLRNLTLKSIAFPPPFLSDLTTLSLSECKNSFTRLPPSLSDLVDMLISCPRLCSLHLDLPSPSTTHKDYPVVDLPELDWLRLFGNVASCAVLLNHMRLPPRTSIQILPFGVHSGMNVRDILVPIRKHLRSPGAQKPLLLHIDRGPIHCRLSLFLGTAPRRFFDCDSARCTLSLNSHPSSEGTLRQIITKFLQAIPESITHLDASFASLGEVSWKTMVPLLSSLETVFLRVHSGAIACLHALHQLETPDGMPQAMPHIRRLHVYVVENTEEDTATVVRAGLEAYVKIRFGNGTPLETLEIDDQSYRFAGQVTEESLERMFPLMKGQILRNGVVFDPVVLKEKRAQREAFRRAKAAEWGIEI